VRILVAGDVVGSPGRRALKELLPRLREREHPDAILVNAENAAGGRGLSAKLAGELLDLGIDAITLGDHLWDQKDLIPHLGRERRILRPANLPPDCPGARWRAVSTPAGSIVVISLLGRVFMPPVADCPFRCIDELLREPDVRAAGPAIVDFHAEATSEKIAMSRFLDGRAAAVFGTHTHVQTADEQVLPGGAAAITDIGMTGPVQSVLGREIGPVLAKFKTGMPSKFDVAGGPIRLEGVVIDLDPSTGRASAIRRIRENLDE
jgi:2',3'-cyclic-nucleotide 2'-phosphodiesterase